MIKIIQIIRFLIIAFLMVYTTHSAAQNMQELSIEKCEEIFLKNNLSLLAQQYNISAKNALIIQAKAYPNPIFSADFNLYNPNTNRYFQVDTSGQKSFQIQQLILLGGKRKIDIDIAKQNKQLAEAEFADLLRTLKYELHSSFYSIYSYFTVITNYEKQLQILDTIINAYKSQAEKGNLPLKDLVRLKSVYISINSKKSELASEFSSEQKNLKILLHSNSDVLPLINESDFAKFKELKNLNEVQLTAASNRPDLKIADEEAIIAELQIKAKKRQIIPDLSLNASYDQRGGAFRNQINAGLALPIPVFNTNRGNIQAAKFDKQAIDALKNEKILEVEKETEFAWLNMQRTISEFNKVTSLYNSDFLNVNKGINDNFLKRNISILEYVDFIEAYNESYADLQKTKKTLAISAAFLNYVTATKIY